jgi:hypothetical protein
MNVNGKFHTLSALPPTNGPPLPIQQETVWTPEPVWTIWRRDKSPDSVGNRRCISNAVRNSDGLRTQRLVLHLLVLKRCTNVIFFGEFYELRSPDCACCSQSDMTHTTPRSHDKIKWQLQMLSHQLLPTSFAAEESDFHSGNIAHCNRRHFGLFITPNNHITQSIWFFVNI